MPKEGYALRNAVVEDDIAEDDSSSFGAFQMPTSWTHPPLHIDRTNIDRSKRHKRKNL
jgi:hypothetical protein